VKTGLTRWPTPHVAVTRLHPAHPVHPVHFPCRIVAEQDTLQAEADAELDALPVRDGAFKGGFHSALL
jgi:hypothetical protein